MSGRPLLTPRVNANDSDALVLRWTVDRLAPVKTGDPVCEIETTKATVDVEADSDGYLFPLVSPGDRVRVGQPLALILPAPDPALATAASTAPAAPGSSAALVSQSARDLMTEHGLTEADFPGLSVIRRSDVEAIVVDRERASAPAALDGIQGGADAVVLYGAGRHGLVVLDTLRAARPWRVVAFVDDVAKRPVQGVPVFPASRLADLAGRGVVHAHVSMGDTAGVPAAVEKLERAGMTLIQAIHPSAYISPLARLGRGVFAGPLVIVGPDAEIGDLTFLNNACSVAHHCAIARQVILADGARLGGAVRIGRRSLIGINATINKDIAIGENVTVVSGATVFADVPDNAVVRSDGTLHKRAL